jgi:hypothetical protein
MVIYTESVQLKIIHQVRRDEYGHEREHDHSICYKSPLDVLPRTTSWIVQRGHTLEEQSYDNPWTTNRTDDIRTGGERMGLHTVEYCTDKDPREIGLFRKVERV